MLDTPCSEVVWRVLATHSIRQFPLHFPSRAPPCAITFQLESTILQVEWDGTRTETRFRLSLRWMSSWTRWGDGAVVYWQARRARRLVTLVLCWICNVLLLCMANWVSTSLHFHFPFTSPPMLRRVPSHTNRSFTNGFRHIAFKYRASASNRVVMKLVCFELRGWEWIFLSPWVALCYSVWRTCGGGGGFVLLIRCQ